MLDTDLQFYQSLVITDDSTNGGRISPNVITSGVEQNVWPHVFKAERDAGSVKYRKLFQKVNTDDNASLESAQTLVNLPTPGDDWVVMFDATATDTQADITGTERKYGAGDLKTDVASGTATIIAVVEDVSLTIGNDQIFQVGDTIRITDKATPDSGTGNVEDLIIDTVTPSGNDITIVATTNLVNAYAVADGSRVSSVSNASIAVQATTEDFTVTTAGTLAYDDGSYAPILNNRGCVDQVFTLTFTDSANFSVTGDSLTGLPSGNITTDYEAPNANFAGTNYLELEYLGFSGTAVAGDTIEIEVKSASIAKWYRRTVPASSGSLANDKTVTEWTGESL